MGAEFGGRVGEPVDEFLVKVAFEVGGVAFEVAVEFLDGADGGVDDDAAVVAAFVSVKYAFFEGHIASVYRSYCVPRSAVGVLPRRFCRDRPNRCVSVVDSYTDTVGLLFGPGRGGRVVC